MNSHTREESDVILHFPEGEFPLDESWSNQPRDVVERGEAVFQRIKDDWDTEQHGPHLAIYGDQVIASSKQGHASLRTWTYEYQQEHGPTRFFMATIGEPLLQISHVLDTKTGRVGIRIVN
jgi:hypothetical protein